MQHTVKETTPDPELDFYSESFNALKALRHGKLTTPVQVSPLDYVAKCRSLLPTSDPNYLKPVVKAAPKDNASAEEQKKGPLGVLCLSIFLYQILEFKAVHIFIYLLATVKLSLKKNR
jgi:hypothetical protein